MWVGLIAVVLAVVLLRPEGASQDASPEVVSPEQETAMPAPPSDSEASSALPTGDARPEPLPTFAVPDPTAAVNVAPAPLGTYLIAKPGAGVLLSAPLVGEDTPRLEIPVYDVPFGQPRTLLYENELVYDNEIDGVRSRLPLLNWSDNGGLLALRVVAGSPDDDWIQVQAPTRPHNQVVWVRANDFDFGFTTKRIEIDLAGEGRLRLIDGERALLESAIVQGRETRPTPVHVTYIEGGVAGRLVAPAYGSAVLSMASFSESLGTFGGGGAPKNFLHGMNFLEVLGQRVSSGEIRIPNEVLNFVVEAAEPGTPVLLFDSSDERPGKESILNKVMTSAMTVPFGDAGVPVNSAARLVRPQLWQRCDGVALLICRGDRVGSAQYLLPNIDHYFLVAKPDAGEIVSVSDELGEREVRVIPVFDTPNGPPQVLVYENPVDGISLDYPLFSTTVFAQPLVLSLVVRDSGDDWLLVRAPVLPHNRWVWVRADDFDVHTTTVRVEVDVGYVAENGDQGIMRVFDGPRELLSAPISAGRESRPTTLTTTYVDQVIDGPLLAPAYGPKVVSTASFSEHLGTFGGGGLPQQAIHGVSGAHAIGQPRSSGSIHVSDDVATELASIDGILGAPVVFYDSSNSRTDREVIAEWVPAFAVTKPLDLATLIAPIPSYL